MFRSALRHLACAAFCCFSLPIFAHGYTLGSISIGHPWARATPATATTAGAFLGLTNKGEADRLVSASTPIADAVELHEMRMEGTTMRMQKLPQGIALPAGSEVKLAPGGLHVMLFGLKQGLQQGQSFPLRLRFEKAGEIEVSVKIEAPGAAAAPAHGHTH